MQNQTLSWVNGELSSSINIADRGLAYGHGVFETLLVVQGEIPLKKLHLQRLNLGCKVLQLPLSETELESHLSTALSENPYSKALLKITVTAGVAERGYAAKVDKVNTIIQLYKAPPVEGNQLTKGVHIKLCEYRLASNPLLAGIKHLNRLEQVIAAQELDVGSFDEALLLDNQDNVIEALSRNVFCKTDTGWVTPVLDRAGVKGVMREYLLQSVFPSLGITVQQMDLPVSTFKQAKEVFICNSVTGIWPVLSLDGEISWPVGDDTKQLIRQLGELQACYPS